MDKELYSEKALELLVAILGIWIPDVLQVAFWGVVFTSKTNFWSQVARC